MTCSYDFESNRHHCTYKSSWYPLESLVGAYPHVQDTRVGKELPPFSMAGVFQRMCICMVAEGTIYTNWLPSCLTYLTSVFTSACNKTISVGYSSTAGLFWRGFRLFINYQRPLSSTWKTGLDGIGSRCCFPFTNERTCRSRYLLADWYM